MAYQLLKQVLPIDIVNIVFEYHTPYNEYELHLLKECINANIRMIGQNIDFLHSLGAFKYAEPSIKIIKKQNCANTYGGFKEKRSYVKLCNIVEIVPKDIDKIRNKINKYMEKNTRKCRDCRSYNKYNRELFFCYGCDYSYCKDNEIFKQIF